MEIEPLEGYEKPKLIRMTNNCYNEKLEKQIQDLKIKNIILQGMYDDLLENIKISKLKKRSVIMTPEQDDICEIFRMDL